MTQHIDRFIAEVRYGQEHAYIVQVRGYANNNGSVGANYSQLRQNVIADIKKGIKYETIFRNSEGKWQHGMLVTIVTINGTEFIKTKNDGIKRDNLDNLPEF